MCLCLMQGVGVPDVSALTARRAVFRKLPRRVRYALAVVLSSMDRFCFVICSFFHSAHGLTEPWTHT